MEGYKTKKPTKKQMIDSIPQLMNEELKKNYIKNLIQGSEIAYNMMLEYINEGHTLEEVKSFIEKILENKKVMEIVTLGECEKNKVQKETNSN